MQWLRPAELCPAGVSAQLRTCSHLILAAVTFIRVMSFFQKQNWSWLHLADRFDHWFAGCHTMAFQLQVHSLAPPWPAQLLTQITQLPAPPVLPGNHLHQHSSRAFLAQIHPLQ